MGCLELRPERKVGEKAKYQSVYYKKPDRIDSKRSHEIRSGTLARKWKALVRIIK